MSGAAWGWPCAWDTHPQLQASGGGGNKRILSDYYNTSVSKATPKQLKWSPGEFTAIFLPSLLQNDRMVPCGYLLE